MNPELEYEVYSSLGYAIIGQAIEDWFSCMRAKEKQEKKGSKCDSRTLGELMLIERFFRSERYDLYTGGNRNLEGASLINKLYELWKSGVRKPGIGLNLK